MNLKAAVGEDFTATPSSVREYQGKDGKGKYYVVELDGDGAVSALEGSYIRSKGVLLIVQ